MTAVLPLTSELTHPTSLISRKRKARAKPGTSKAETQPTDNASAWQPRGHVRRANYGFWDFMTRHEVADAWRPKSSGLKESTAKGYWGDIHQMYEEMGYDLESSPLVWETQEPPWHKIHAWAGGGEQGAGMRRAQLRGHQKMLRWLCAYWGLMEPNFPYFIHGNWGDPKQVNRAIAAGMVQTRDRHLTVHEFRTLLASRPFEDQLRSGRRWNDAAQRKLARYKDDMFVFMVGFGAYAAPRPGEWKFLRAEMLVPSEKRFEDWPQEKKDMKPRSQTLPEETIWTGDKRVFPSVSWYLREVRPAKNAPGAMFLQPNGQPYADPAEAILRKGMNLVLGPDAPSAHALRRFAATEAWISGWSEDAICRLLDDDWKNVKASYINWDREEEADRDGRPNKNPRTVHRANGNRTLWKELANAENASILEASPANADGSVQNTSQAGRTLPRLKRVRPPSVQQRSSTPETPSEASPSSLPFTEASMASLAPTTVRNLCNPRTATTTYCGSMLTPVGVWSLTPSWSLTPISADEQRAMQGGS